MDLLNMLIIFIGFTTCDGSVWEKTKRYRNSEEHAAFPCKLHNKTQLDCSQRSLNEIPILPKAVITSITFERNNFSTIPASSFKAHPEILHLDFTYGNIADLHQDTFLGLRNLTSLALSINRIATLPTGVFNDLSNLQFLDLSVNHISIFPSEALEPLTSLTELYLDNNRITTLPTVLSMHLLPIRKLKMSAQTWSYYTDDNSGNLSSIILHKRHFQYIPNLVHFEWVFNPFIYEESDLFAPLKHLETLFIPASGYNAIESVSQTLSTLSVVVFSSQDNSKEDIASNGVLGTSSLIRLKDFPLLSFLRLQLELISISDNAFSWTPALRKLNLNGNRLQYLSKHALKSLPLLEDLDLSFNCFTSVPINALRLFRHSSYFRHLDLTENSANNCLTLPNTTIKSNVFHVPTSVFRLLPSLRVLDLSENKLSHAELILPSNMSNLEELYLDNVELAKKDKQEITPWKMPLSSLKVLSLTRVPQNYIDFDSLCTMAPKLEKLILAGTLVSYFSFLGHCQKLRMLDMSDNQITSDLDFYNIYIDQDRGWMVLNLSKLEVLILRNNKLSFLYENTFDESPSLVEIDLSVNSLTNIHINVFSSLTHLQKLNLSRNKLVQLEFLLNLHSTIMMLDVSSNKVVAVTTDFLHYIKSAPSLKTLDLSGNPLQCSCTAKPFQDWIFHDIKVLLQIHTGLSYICATLYSGHDGVVITAVPLDCKNHLVVYIGIGFAVFIIFSTLSGAVLLKYRWHINYKCFLLFKRSKRHTSYIDDETLAESSSIHGYGKILVECSKQAGINPLYFDAYVACSKHDEEWVFNYLRPRLEDTENPVKLCLGSRDFPLGLCILDCIVDAIQKSRKTILILSPRFVEDEWCYFELQMAQQRLFQDNRDVLVMVLYEEIQNDKLTLLLRRLLCQKDYLKWPSDEFGQKLFLERLKEEILSSSKVDRINCLN